MINTNLFGPYTHLPLPQKRSYAEDVPRWDRATAEEISQFGSLGLGKLDGKLGVWHSRLEGAGMGMFSKVIFEVGEEIEPIKGREVSGAAECLHGGRYAVDVEEYQGGPRMCVDMGEENSCYTRFANDSLNDDEDNCRPVLINGKPYLIALVKIYPGDELTYSYDYE